MRDPKTGTQPARYSKLARIQPQAQLIFAHIIIILHVYLTRRYTLVACTNVYRPREPRALRRLGLVERPREVGKQIPPVLAAGGEPQQVLGHACSNTLKGGRIGSVGGG